MPSWTCASVGCTKWDTSLVIDANWRWLHDDQLRDCWGTVCAQDPEQCARACSLEGVSLQNYAQTYGVHSIEGGVQLDFLTRGNVGSRLYLLQDEGRYRTFHLLNHEFSFTVDVSQLSCGMNGALYFVEMPPDGGRSSLRGFNEAGAALGTGYCDAQCPRDLKFVKGHGNPQGAHGSCCAEMDLWETNSRATAFTAHSCRQAGLFDCQGPSCDGVCDRGGCDVNPYRLGDRTFFGPGSSFRVDSSKPFTVITRFHTEGALGEGELSEIRRYYVQDDRVIADASSISGPACQQRADGFKTPNGFSASDLTAAMRRGLVLVLSIWDDPSSDMQWLDGTFPRSAAPGEVGTARGPCRAGEGANARGQGARAYVRYTDIKHGPIGSTFPIPP
jgi:cellulose 1,4-beta-cellobiosidase